METVFYTAEEVSGILKVSTSAIYEGKAGTKGLRRVRLGRHVRFPKADVEALIAKLLKQATARKFNSADLEEDYN